jgi:CheY-like chemotaxis protein
MQDRSDGTPAFPSLTEADLAAMQLEAIDAWNRARRMAEHAAQARNASRETRMDLSRRMEVLRAQHRAIVERADRHLQDSVHLLARRAPHRAVLVHRNEWFVDRLAAGLEGAGVAVVERLANGAEGIGVVVAEQPDVLVVEEALPMVQGIEVVRGACQFSPRTLVVAQVDNGERVSAMLEAGADRAYARRIPPGDIAADIAALLRVPRLVDA